MSEEVFHIVNDNGYTFFWCPGCSEPHAVNIKTWIYNGDPLNPTLSPSVLVTNNYDNQRCHSYITNGSIQFLEDCSHDLRSQTVKLKAYEAERDAYYGSTEEPI